MINKKNLDIIKRQTAKIRKLTRAGKLNPVKEISKQVYTMTKKYKNSKAELEKNQILFLGLLKEKE